MECEKSGFALQIVDVVPSVHLFVLDCEFDRTREQTSSKFSDLCCRLLSTYAMHYLAVLVTGQTELSLVTVLLRLFLSQVMIRLMMMIWTYLSPV
jgi:hypothetical protein